MTSTKALLREARRDDVPALQRIRGAVKENVLTSRTIPDAEVAAALEGAGRGWVVEADGEVVGFAVGNSADGNVWALFVLPEHERRGHGRLLHDAVVAWLWSRGCERLWLSTDPGTRAERFYEAAGWRRVERLPSGELLLELLKH